MRGTDRPRTESGWEWGVGGLACSEGPGGSGSPTMCFSFSAITALTQLPINGKIINGTVRLYNGVITK